MPPQFQRHIAAVDLGSNSFHMIIVRVDEGGHVLVLDRLRESVRLRAGLDKRRHLDPVVQQRALECLQRFGDRIHRFPSADVAAVGTNTLRQTRNAREFLDQAELALGHPVSVISGHEEARLIYLGVSHALAEQATEKRFVMDIGGGSTELIIGQGHEPLEMESLHMGCVSNSLKYFPDGRLERSCWKKALTAARLELVPVQQSFQDIGWETATGASGTIKAVLKAIQQCGLGQFGITLEGMQGLRERMQDAGQLGRLNLPGLSDERKPVFAGGLAILIATFEALGIREMQVSDGALREGLVYDRISRFRHEDMREKTVAHLQKRFQIEVRHATAVRATALDLFERCREAWDLPEALRELLGWAADLHELGLSVSHSGYHKHGGYLLEHLDLAGFSTEEQHWLSLLVRTHRRKLAARLFESVESARYRHAISLSVLLRLAVLLQRSRARQPVVLERIQVERRTLGLVFAFADGNEQRPLLVADLEQEKDYLKQVGIKLRYSGVSV
ncbi:MAG: Ppx/GppA family phosphatase [Thiothrix sp.]|nr:Ppx/GppA family phosphatase [Thiothrix sp.]